MRGSSDRWFSSSLPLFHPAHNTTHRNSPSTFVMENLNVAHLFSQLGDAPVAFLWENLALSPKAAIYPHSSVQDTIVKRLDPLSIRDRSQPIAMNDCFYLHTRVVYENPSLPVVKNAQHLREAAPSSVIHQSSIIEAFDDRHRHPSFDLYAQKERPNYTFVGIEDKTIHRTRYSTVEFAPVVNTPKRASILKVPGSDDCPGKPSGLPKRRVTFALPPHPRHSNVPEAHETKAAEIKNLMGSALGLKAKANPEGSLRAFLVTRRATAATLCQHLWRTIVHSSGFLRAALIGF
ncbi:hypothetical protein BOTBODRAFT_286890 [Botryobasidium botryosum FD-172 SS1]|uniref:Uncharacterized protein n=1 Tax=Botryobasidium botryosum (strain FD-172 SS1) TaxID=930990 RepID=A0A067MW04_BOTB1|nr:hypothetical protein BOTBODRAFT_286890 [Botryobasidium botryosum FD-172 SS1]